MKNLKISFFLLLSFLNYSASQVTSALADKKHVIGIFINPINLSKAFDNISHEKLLVVVKLSNFGIRGNAHAQSSPKLSY